MYMKVLPYIVLNNYHLVKNKRGYVEKGFKKNPPRVHHKWKFIFEGIHLLGNVSRYEFFDK
jgi:hypothetical protein